MQAEQQSEREVITVASIRAAGGIVHSDGNIFFTNIDQLRAALSHPSTPQGWQPDVPEGCTPHDAKVLREANHEFAEENQQLRKALRFYASREHFNLADSDAWDTVSGEPQNWWCDEAGTATIEDGAIAAMALRGESIDWGGEDGLPEPPICPGEPESLIPAPPPPEQGGKV